MYNTFEIHRDNTNAVSQNNLVNDTITNAQTRQQTLEKTNFNNDVQNLCDKLNLCLLLTEETDENIGIVYFFTFIILSVI